MNQIFAIIKWFPAIGLLLGSGCAIDFVHVRQEPVTFTSLAENTQSPDPGFILAQNVEVRIGTGFPTRLKSGTRWFEVGKTEHGIVYSTKDQIVTVEASNIFEAHLVVSNQSVVGFYLPVEKKFTPVKIPIHIEIEPIYSNP